MPLIGELTVTCLPDVSSGEVFAMDFPVDDGVSCLATNTMKIKKRVIGQNVCPFWLVFLCGSGRFSCSSC
ncbi:hypothetical protein PMS61_03850, partial [Bifidobacterium longum]|uniref:hypothetical protein n=1 Tax=Bifidobacterium longum TaxID=216816 RepID=UPI001E30C2CD